MRFFLANLTEVTSSESKLSGREEKKKFVALTRYIRTCTYRKRRERKKKMEAEKEKSGRRKIYTTPRPLRPLLQSQKCIGQPSLIKSASDSGPSSPLTAPLFPGDVMGDVDIQKKRGGKKGKWAFFGQKKGGGGGAFWYLGRRWGWGILSFRSEEAKKCHV